MTIAVPTRAAATPRPEPPKVTNPPPDSLRINHDDPEPRVPDNERLHP